MNNFLRPLQLSFLLIFFPFKISMYAQAVKVTFQVDMNYESVSFNGVFIAGDFQSVAGFGADWNPGSTQLKDRDGDQVYSVTVDITPGRYEYKFINGNTWGNDESPLGDCVVGSTHNRVVRVEHSDLILPVVPFNACNPKGSLLVATEMHFCDTGKDGMPGEPMLVEHPDGTLFLGGYADSPYRVVLYSSHDAGRSWKSEDLGDKSNGAVGNSDVDLTIASDSSVHMAALTWGEDQGLGISVVSRLPGASTWTWQTVSQVLGDDRPWIEATPDGTLHLVWHNRQGIQYARSFDSGVTWQQQPPIHTAGNSSHFAVGPNGELAVRITPRSWSSVQPDESVDFIAVSMDGGAHWFLYPAPGDRKSDSIYISRWVDPIAWDAVGSLYYVWSEGNALWIGRSTDRGQTWSSEKVRTSETKIYYPYIDARGEGEIAAVWFEGQWETRRCMAGHMTFDLQKERISKVLTRPLFFESMLEWPIQSGIRIIPINGAGEYEPVIFLHDGRIAVATEVFNAVDKRWGFRMHILEVW